MFKKFLATFATLLIATGLSVVAVAAPASAHHTDISATAACTTDGGWDVTWTVVNSENFAAKITESNNSAIPADTTLPANPKYGQANQATNTFVQHVTSNSAITTTLTVKWMKQSGTVTDTKSYTFNSFPAACGTPPTPGTNTVDCTAATIYTNRALTNGDHINMDVVQGGTKFQLNASVDIRQSQDPASESGLVLRIHQKTGPDIVLPITNAQKQSGSFSFQYSTYLTGKWTVEWVQFNSSYFNQDRNSANFLKCGSDPADAAASISITPATCDAGEQLVLGAVTNATWGSVTGAYSVTATAATDHIFPADSTPGVTVSADGKTKTFTGTLAGKKTDGCVTEPECLPRSSVKYTYDPATNSGQIIVTNPNPSKYSNDLCQGFWVTAASWYYTGDGVWPQIRNQVQKLDKITSVGTYDYKADVECGQGDIYASFVAQPDPTYNLYGPSNPFPETFLHNMGFGTTTPGNTWTQTPTGCNEVPVEPATAKAITECGTYGSVYVPADTDKIDYTLTGNGQTGINTVTAVAIAPYVLKDYPTGGWTFNLGAYTDCELSITLTYVPDCAVDETNTWSIYNPGEESIVVSYAGGTHTATPGYSTLETAASDDAFTITWGETGSGIKPGEATVTPGADLPADDPKCIKLAEPVEPKLVTVNECGTYGSVTPVEKPGVAYEVTFNQETGDYEVTATPEFGYYFENDADQKIVYSGNVGAYYDCVEEPNASIAYGECVYNEDGTAQQRHVWITFDNTASNKPVLFQVPYFSEYDQWVAAGDKVEFQVADIWAAGGGYQVTAAGKTFELTIDGCDLPTLPDPKVWEVPTVTYDCSTTTATVSTITYTQGWVFDTETVEWVEGPITQSEPVITTRPMTAEEIGSEKCLVAITDPVASTCLNQTDETDLTSWIRIMLDPNVEYRIDGTLATTEFVSVAPGLHTVTADALNGFTLSGGNPDAWTDTHHEWTFTAVDYALACEPPTLATVTPEFSYTPLTCTAAGSYTLGELTEDTVQWTVNGVEKPMGTYPVTTGQTLTFEAQPVLPEDGLDEDFEQPGAITFTTGSAPCDLVKLAMTGGTASFGLVWVALLLGLTGIGFVLIRRRTATEK